MPIHTPPLVNHIDPFNCLWLDSNLARWHFNPLSASVLLHPSSFSVPSQTLPPSLMSCKCTGLGFSFSEVRVMILERTKEMVFASYRGLSQSCSMHNCGNWGKRPEYFIYLFSFLWFSYFFFGFLIFLIFLLFLFFVFIIFSFVSSFVFSFSFLFWFILFIFWF